MAEPIIVLKFGSSVIPSESALAQVVGEVRRWRHRGYRVVAVVSAIGGATDSLLAHASAYGEGAGAAALAAYVATGELQSASLLGLALGRAGIHASVRDAAAVGLLTDGPVLNASPVSLDDEAVHRALRASPVLIVPGFLGRSPAGETTLLGRGGSDLTALFIAQRLGARCRLVKDVDGLYDRDPAEHAAAARLFAVAAFDDVLALSEGIVQHKAVRFARDGAVDFEVGALGADEATLVCAGPSAWASVGDRAPCAAAA